MKSNQIMKRPMGQFEVLQRTCDGYFDANALLTQWNSVEDNPRRRMSEFLDSPKTKEFLEALREDVMQSGKTDNAEIQFVKHIKGRNTVNGKTKGQVWLHPYLFIKFAMWINPRFELQVIKFVSDKMLYYRNEAGDAYRKLSSSVASIVPKGKMEESIRKVAEALNWIVFDGHEHLMRNRYGDEAKQRELWELERKVSDLINEGFIDNYRDLIMYLRKKYQEKHTPDAFII